MITIRNLKKCLEQISHRKIELYKFKKQKMNKIYKQQSFRIKISKISKILIHKKNSISKKIIIIFKLLNKIKKEKK